MMEEEQYESGWGQLIQSLKELSIWGVTLKVVVR